MIAGRHLLLLRRFLLLDRSNRRKSSLLPDLDSSSIQEGRQISLGQHFEERLSQFALLQLSIDVLVRVASHGIQLVNEFLLVLDLVDLGLGLSSPSSSMEFNGVCNSYLHRRILWKIVQFHDFLLQLHRNHIHHL